MASSLRIAALLALATAGAAPPPPGFDRAPATTATAHGDRLTYVLGCRGCHGATLQGDRFFERYASNLTRAMPRYTDAAFDRLVRHGERSDGQDVWSMPSEVFQHLGDADFRALTAYLRSLPPAGPADQPPLPFNAEARAMIARGDYKPAARAVIADRRITPPDTGAAHAQGRYIAMLTCAECHGPDLKGRPGDTPDLAVAAAYTRPEFETLMTRGIATGNRTLHPLMASVARHRFSRLTPHERDALHAYLVARAQR